MMTDEVPRTSLLFVDIIQYSDVQQTEYSNVLFFLEQDYFYLVSVIDQLGGDFFTLIKI